jgi:HPt (histidine-containing phosphotransfer) domain-containing protein
MIDWAQVRASQSDVGDEIFDEVVKIFDIETRELLRALEGGKTDAERSKIAHSIRGSAVNFGMSDMVEAAKQIEQQPEDIAHVATLRQAYDSAINMFLTNLGTKRLNQEFG